MLTIAVTSQFVAAEEPTTQPMVHHPKPPEDVHFEPDVIKASKAILRNFMGGSFNEMRDASRRRDV